MALILVASVGLGAWVFRDGFAALASAWSLPEYSHGPLIPVLSALMFLREMRLFRRNRVESLPGSGIRPGLAILCLALALAALGQGARIDEVGAYAIILWVLALILLTFGRAQGWAAWPSVLHLVFMLPLPGVLYYKLSTFLQQVSSELGVWLLKLAGVPVFLEGNIIDLGVLQLHVAEACSGLRYLFPILSFAYVFAVLYRGPAWHRGVLLLAAAPIAVAMNALRIALAGGLVQVFGAGHLQGASHFFEGWVIFLLSVLVLSALAWGLVRLPRGAGDGSGNGGLMQALDLDLGRVGADLAALRRDLARAPLRGPAFGLGLMLLAACALQLRPERQAGVPERLPFAAFPARLGVWQGTRPPPLPQAVRDSLAAEDVLDLRLRAEGGTGEVRLFSAWYPDQTRGGVHSPEICLPGAGWEIASLERRDMSDLLHAAGHPGSQGADAPAPFRINRAVVQKGRARVLVYYWFDSHGRRMAWDMAVKLMLLWDGAVLGRTDGALVRLDTEIAPGEPIAQAEARLTSAFLETVARLPDFIPAGELP